MKYTLTRIDPDATVMSAIHIEQSQTVDDPLMHKTLTRGIMMGKRLEEVLQDTAPSTGAARTPCGPTTSVSPAAMWR
jgi:hypothetical protein